VGELQVDIPAGGIAAFLGSNPLLVAGGGDATFPARETVRVPAPVVRVDAVPDGFVEVAAAPRVTTVFRIRETGAYGETPFVEEWKPLPPRLHALAEMERDAVAASRFAIGVREEPVTGLSLAEARAYAAERGARLPTEDEWQLGFQSGLLERATPLVWNWTESEHTDGRTRFAILKGGSAWKAEGSEWYVDGGEQAPAYSLKLLLAGPLQRSVRIGFRLAVDL
jgi:formylglycine-generating enzyme required for sulfatase activity